MELEGAFPVPSSSSNSESLLQVRGDDRKNDLTLVYALHALPCVRACTCLCMPARSSCENTERQLPYPEVLAGALADLEERRMAGDLAAAAPLLGLVAFAFCFAVVLQDRVSARLTDNVDGKPSGSGLRPGRRSR